MTPAFKNHPSLKRLSFRRYDQTIVFAPCVAVRVSPVQFKRLEFQRVQGKKEILGPLLAIPAFPPAVINQEIVKDRRAKRPILLP